MNTLLDRYIAVLTGVLAGDVLGAPYETWSAAKIRDDFVARGGLVPFDYDDPWKKAGRVGKGQPTDDSELTAALAESLIVCFGFEEKDLFERLRSFIHGRKSILTSGEAFGSGGTLRSALEPATYAESLEKFRLGKVPVVPSNGSLMRAAPIALRYHGDFDALDEVARRAGIVTHVHPLAVECTAFYTVVLDRLLAGYSIGQAVDAARRSLKPYLTEESLIKYLRDELFAKPDEPDKHNRGGALITLQVALWAAAYARTFREGIICAIGIGGDTDTYGAVAGGLLGAMYGERGDEHIPSEWREVMSGKGYEVMKHLAHRLYEIRSAEYGT